MSVTLDIRSPAGAEIVKRLVKVSDVVVENFAAGVMTRTLTVPILKNSTQTAPLTVDLRLTHPTGFSSLGGQAGATLTINAEMDFTWELARKVAPDEVAKKYSQKGKNKGMTPAKLKEKSGPKVSKTLGGE